MSESREIDQSTEKGARAADRLRNDRVAWLTTVAEDGTPQTSPIWYLWDGRSILMYSLDSARVRNIRPRPRVSLNLDGDGLGGGIVVIEGTARVDEDAPTAADNPDYLAKYQPVMDDYGWTADWFSGMYHVPVRIEASRYRYW